MNKKIKVNNNKKRTTIKNLAGIWNNKEGDKIKKFAKKIRREVSFKREKCFKKLLS